MAQANQAEGFDATPDFRRREAPFEEEAAEPENAPSCRVRMLGGGKGRSAPIFIWVNAGRMSNAEADPRSPHFRDWAGCQGKAKRDLHMRQPLLVLGAATFLAVGGTIGLEIASSSGKAWAAQAKSVLPKTSCRSWSGTATAATRPVDKEIRKAALI